MRRKARSWRLSISLALAAALLGSTPTHAEADANAPAEPASIDNPADATADAREDPNAPSEPAPIDDRADAAEADGWEPRRKFIRWNEYEGPYFTIRLGAGLLVDAVAYSQDAASKKQMTLAPAAEFRDFRILLKGRIKLIPRLSYTLGYMYDGAAQEWRFRQTGLMIDVPELWGRLFIGRTKEGISMNKLMVGYHGWTMERATANDAFVPILADGVKWLGTSPRGSFVYSVGAYGDALSEQESFNKFDTQAVARGVWLPLPFDAPDAELVHLGLGYRWAKPDDGFFQFRSKPESFPAQSQAIDTGQFPADYANLLEPEIYYRRGPWVVGTEYFLNFVSSKETGDPFLHGGEIVCAYIITGETRPYNRKGAYFEAVSPARPVVSNWFLSGWGAWELVARLSYSDLDDNQIQGGKFLRFTPGVNWYMTDNVRVMFNYGYGVLDRFGLKGDTNFFATRVQVLL